MIAVTERNEMDSITVEKKDLLEAIKVLKKLKVGSPGLCPVAISVREDGASLECRSRNFSFDAAIGPAAPGESWFFTIELSQFEKAVRAATKSIVLAMDLKHVFVGSGRYPITQDDTVLTQGFIKLVGNCYHSVKFSDLPSHIKTLSDTSIRSYGTVAKVDPANGHIVSTDGFRLVLSDIEAPETCPSFTLRRNHLAAIAALGSKVEIGVDSSGNVAFHARGCVVQVILPNIKYPNYVAILPKGFDEHKYRFNVEALKRALTSVLVAGDKSRAVLLKFRSGTLELNSRNPDKGTNGYETISEETDNFYSCEVSINGGFLLDHLKTIKEKEIAVRLGKKPSEDPVTISGDETSLIVVPTKMNV